jgi:translation initiation factor IF-3
MVGVVDIAEAMARAYEAGLDLVEVAPESSPPVCRILDFGKYKYELSKKEKANKAKSKTVELKEVRLGRSLKIDPHDIQIRLNQARKFLLEGHKVQIVQNFRGREMMHRERGNQRMKDVIDTLDDIAKVELAPRMAGRRMNMILAPDKRKVDQYKKKLAQENTSGEPSEEDVEKESKQAPENAIEEGRDNPHAERETTATPSPDDKSRSGSDQEISEPVEASRE